MCWILTNLSTEKKSLIASVETLQKEEIALKNRRLVLLQSLKELELAVQGKQSENGRHQHMTNETGHAVHQKVIDNKGLSEYIRLQQETLQKMNTELSQIRQGIKSIEAKDKP
jgi:hypothetical protein